ncbi:DNA replication and repair protein RecF [Chitinophaga terrae (ex Kim and Jung 2007)]|uniref:DNA replication/repair protein RecF n=1 Tax=Chitinophaga terrae (ex Kim and Jung 2007) TaxID=408074 RepID=UPI002780E81A|nr:DNA replication and repair protein RecF [Chitinophaga terrae (ex Kim and Jung 2007)]MDQ0106370.1 DNA replication and repair protein RecF [Chitinophaga terrae (ex Kim and Jung 2007)]
MLYINNISLVQFKNYQQSTFEFNNRIVGITGPNGVGKTNLLDAIYYLCFTKSYFTSNETQNTQYNTNGFRLTGDFLKNGHTDKVIVMVKDGKKEISLNDEKYDRFSRHLGQFPAVMIAPDDAEIILGGSEDRRKWLDSLLSQIYPEYLDHLIIYQKILLQRNTLLKNMADSPNADQLLDIFDLQLVMHGQPVHDLRKSFLASFVPKVQQLYDYIAGTHETVNIQYVSTLTEASFSDQLNSARFKDMQVQRTTTGIHRDDLLFLLNEHPMKASASQGQRKSFLFALKLAQFEVLKVLKHLPPLLLLDDVFEKLDQERISRLIKLVAADSYGQVFITDTHAERLQQAFQNTSASIQLLPV